MRKEFIDRIRREGSVKTKKYYYAIGPVSGHAEIRRIERAKITDRTNFKDMDYVCSVQGWPSEEDTKDWDPIP